MFSVDAFRAHLDAGFEDAVGRFQEITANMDVLSADDMHLFNQSQREVAVMNWAANQDVVLTHNLVKAIINEVK